VFHEFGCFLTDTELGLPSDTESVVRATMETVRTCETSVYFNETIRPCTQEDC
jgi:hypothetical protein